MPTCRIRQESDPKWRTFKMKAEVPGFRPILHSFVGHMRSQGFGGKSGFYMPAIASGCWGTQMTIPLNLKSKGEVLAPVRHHLPLLFPTSLYPKFYFRWLQVQCACLGKAESPSQALAHPSSNCCHWFSPGALSIIFSTALKQHYLPWAASLRRHPPSCYL